MDSRSGKTLSRSLSAADDMLHSNMKGEESRTPLPEELVERILAMVPFPQIFRARALSKSWHARLSSISSQDDEEKKLLAVSFQNQVCEWSDKWNTSCPVFLVDDFLIAYDRASQLWRKIPTLSVLPYREAMVMKAHSFGDDGIVLSSLVGALLFINDDWYPDCMFVVNIFTGNWKELPAVPHGDPQFAFRLVRLVSSKGKYKVIRLYSDVGCVCAWIYDSKLGAWRNKRLEIPEALKYLEVSYLDAYVNGVIYTIVNDVDQMFWGFLAFDVKEETFNLLQMQSMYTISDSNLPQMLSMHLIADSYLLQPVACNGTVYIVVTEETSLEDGEYASRTVFLLEADVVSRRWTRVIRGPPATLKFGFFSVKPSSDGDCLFFRGHGKILAYNVRKHEWSYFATSPMLKQRLRSVINVTWGDSFQPGMNPFLEV